MSKKLFWVCIFILTKYVVKSTPALQYFLLFYFSKIFFRAKSIVYWVDFMTRIWSYHVQPYSLKIACLLFLRHMVNSVSTFFDVFLFSVFQKPYRGSYPRNCRDDGKVPFKLQEWTIYHFLFVTP